MTTNQESKLNMYMTVRKFLIANDAVTKNLPNFAASFPILQSTIDQIYSIGEMQKSNKTGLTVEKNKLKETLKTLGADYSRKITAFAKFTNDDSLLKEAKFSDSDLVRTSDVDLKEYVQIIYDIADRNLGSLAEYGITAETQKVFMDNITAYKEALATPRFSITEKSQATKQLGVLFDSADSVLENIDFAVGIIKLKEPNFHNGYKTARRLVDLSSGTLALKATVKDIANGEPVKGVLFTFSPDGAKATSSGGNGEITKKTAEKGSFHIKNMQSGTYRVSVRKPGYKDKEVTVSVSDGERSELNVEIEKA